MNIYKKIIIAALGVCVLSAGVYATEQLSGEKLNVQPKIDQNIVDNLNGTRLRFCNDGFDSGNLTLKSYLTSKPGQIQKICTMFLNTLDKDMNIYVGFSEATKNKYDERLCNDDMTNNAFSKLIREDFNTMKIPVKAHMQSYQKFTMTIPKDTTGDIIGCLSYTIDGSLTHNTGEVFGILIRKTAPIQITVTGAVYQFGRRDDMKDGVTTNKAGILKVIIAIIAVWLVVTIFQTTKKKEKHHKK